MEIKIQPIAKEAWDNAAMILVTIDETAIELNDVIMAFDHLYRDGFVVKPILFIPSSLHVRPLDAAAIEILAENVHKAWMAEKIRVGYADHVFRPKFANPGLMADGSVDPTWEGCCNQPSGWHHYEMRPFAELTAATKDLNRAIARSVIQGIISYGAIDSESPNR